jgi:hypothetical protein
MGVERIIGHKEWAGPTQGKWDPGAIDMNIFRVDVAARLNSSPGDDELSAEAERLIREMRTEIRELRDEWGKDKLGPSRSFLATDGKGVESPLGFLYNIDGNVWTVVLTFGYLFHVRLAVEVVETVAEKGSYEGSWAESREFNAWLNEFGQEYCKGLVGFKKHLVEKLTGEQQVDAEAGTPQSAPQLPSVAAIASAVAALIPAPDNSGLADVYSENARLREENARLQAAAPTESSALATFTAAKTSGERVGQLIDSVEDWTELALAMDTKQRAALAASIKVLEMPNGSQS